MIAGGDRRLNFDSQDENFAVSCGEMTTSNYDRVTGQSDTGLFRSVQQSLSSELRNLRTCIIKSMLCALFLLREIFLCGER